MDTADLRSEDLRIDVKRVIGGDCTVTVTHVPSGLMATADAATAMVARKIALEQLAAELAQWRRTC